MRESWELKELSSMILATGVAWLRTEHGRNQYPKTSSTMAAKMKRKIKKTQN